VRQSDTALIGHATGAFGSTGSVFAGQATERTAVDLRDRLLDLAARRPGVDRAGCRLDGNAVIGGASRVELGSLPETIGVGSSDGTPRSIAFTGKLRILHSVQAADAGRVRNPMQCRGQVEGGAARAIGSALYEELRIDAAGRVENLAAGGYRRRWATEHAKEGWQILSGRRRWYQHPISTRFQMVVPCPFANPCYAVNKVG
jgi:putative selenate reductase molybdopterin-binding subunit